MVNSAGSKPWPAPTRSTVTTSTPPATGLVTVNVPSTPPLATGVKVTSMAQRAPAARVRPTQRSAPASTEYAGSPVSRVPRLPVGPSPTLVSTTVRAAGSSAKPKSTTAAPSGSATCNTPAPSSPPSSASPDPRRSTTSGRRPSPLIMTTPRRRPKPAASKPTVRAQTSPGARAPPGSQPSSSAGDAKKSGSPWSCHSRPSAADSPLLRTRIGRLSAASPTATLPKSSSSGST